MVSETFYNHIKPWSVPDCPIWQRFMRKALEKTNLKERFTEHDLRAKVASDLKSEHARQLLGHTNIEITNRVYRRKAEKVRPTK